ncbi:uncharacterized protein LOC123308601 [Coccinella septempunctata]|uniref:uncharacterized protein LOC123308601 n=1 Tax=Coccinella septempunctata TaxID=41139 RepID=UPI001D0643CE|nr:uncharacterized protein LOC123308601 [Coccinella septempunctata]
MYTLGAITFFAVVAAASASLHGIHGGAVIAGPAGSITANGLGHAAVVGPTGLNLGHAGLGLGVLGAPGLLAARGLGLGALGPLGLAAHLDVGHGGLVGSGIEGQWVPDINEHLYDDGSYKPHVYEVKDSASPVGVLVPAGSGLEGQWVPDINERLHDDGSYKPEIYGA